MGAVFEAEGPPGVGKRAVKLLHQEYVAEAAVLARFVTEAQATMGFNHPNVAQVFETARAENGTPYMVMELLEGNSVAIYVDQKQVLPLAQAVHIAHGVLQALSAAHARSIIHRDIKPDNLFLVREPSGSFHVKVLDFGIAKVMDVAGGMGQKTRTGVLLGTPGYMSPEQIKNSKGVDLRADLWSVGVIFYELLAGASPFPADNDFGKLTSVLTEELRPIEQVAPHLASWSGFFQRALAKEPDQRFQTADEMASALLATARGPSLRPPPTLQGPGPARAPGTTPVEPSSQPASPGAAARPPPANLLTTPMSAMGEYPAVISPSHAMALAATAVPPPAPTPFGQAAQAALAATVVPPPTPMPQGQRHPSAYPPSMGQSQQRPSAYPPSAQQPPSGYPPAASLAQPAHEISGITPPPASAMPGSAPGAYAGTPSGAAPYGAVAAVSQPAPVVRSGTLAQTPPPDLPSHLIGGVPGIGPTHVSAQHPGGPPVMHGHAPSIQVIDAPPIRRGAAWWVVGVVAVVAFGLGLTLGWVLGQP